MPLRIRDASPREDAARIRAVLQRNLPEAAAADRIAWLYAGNPCGPSHVWLAEEEDTGAVAGTSAGHVRRFLVDGRPCDVLNLSDFAIDGCYRTLGPALGLLRATLATVRERGFAFSYDVPSRAMLALYRRMGYAELGPMERRVRPLSLAPALVRRCGSAGRLLAAPAGLLLRARDLWDGRRRGLAVAPLAWPFGEEFDRLDEREAAHFPIRGVRSAAYLEWRYRRHAMWPHRTLTARRGGELVGYLVWREAEPGVLIVAELVCAGDEAVARALVGRLAALGRGQGATSLAVEVLKGSPAAALFQRLRFVKRGEGPGPVVYAPGGAAPGLLDPARWWFLGGDRDI